ncbi:amino acid adenylation domain-containing protein [Micromonospora sp. WMMD1102]|uniref:non-ribosomal peptide synthetase n=1 Tax=Micromonospora sp. WMMD1102 TaxID=3016105 RepID=UPI002414EAA0|nr:non-ribosomal peptide synthetase [Micromonospora sp. WMMD1102]MDG4786445.1 amino acid adenylation domain-containing protein [Micromonospora sp. WMMD1102]
MNPDRSRTESAGDLRGPATDAGSANILPALVARQVAATPDAVAVLAGDVEVTYAELDRRANRLARHLRDLGVGPDALVGVCLPRGVELVVALLGVWKAGAGYLPLSPDHPRDWASWVLTDTGAGIVLTESAHAELVAGTGARVVTLDDLGTVLAGLSDEAPGNPAGGDHLAYAIYTSGSTGRPKGVMVSHAAIANRVDWAVRQHGLGPADRVLQKTALTFDAACWEFFAPLVSGGTVVLAPVGAERDPAALVRAIHRHGVTVFQGVPSVLRLVAEEPGWRDCTSLRLLFSAGEPLHAELCRRLTDGLKVTLWNTYGPTECAIDVTAHPYDPALPTGPVPIGRPLANLRVLVLDGNGDPVPVGVAGELHAGGVGVARGYLGRPDLTAEKFVPDPYGPAGSRLYRTGDLVRWRADATLEYIGRLDHQVKVNGVRIEPGEVESALVAHPDVSAAVVLAVEAAEGGKRLVGYVTGERVPAADRLRTFLRDRLPDPMIPAAFVALPEFPLNSSGKVDRAALPAPETAAEDGRPPYVAPRTTAERMVAQAWAELLKVDRVGAHDDFFTLGGSSLLLTRLANQLRSASGSKVALRGLFAAPTVEQQAKLIAVPSDDGPPLHPVPRTGPLPLSFGQRRLWFLDRLEPGNTEWVAPLFVRLGAEIDQRTVRRALDVLAGRHEILRTRYVEDAGEPRQLVDPPGPVELRVVEADSADLETVFRAEFERGFDLATGPVWRALLVRFPGVPTPTPPTSVRIPATAGRAPAGESVLLLTLHHIACDGWSSVVLERELRELCAAVLAGRDPELPAQPVQYPDFASWQRGWLTEQVLAAELAYWRKTLDGLGPLDLPTDRPRPARRNPRGALAPFTIPTGLATAVRDLGRRHGASPYMTMLTAFSTLLARYAGNWDVAVGTPVAGRNRPELENMVGFFLNSLVLRPNLGPGMRFEEALEATREVCRGAFAHQTLPFEQLVDDLQPDRDMSRTPLFQVAFDLHDEGLTGGAVRGDDLAAFTEAWQIAKTDLTLFVRVQADGTMLAALEYATALFDRSTVDRIGRHLVRLLQAVTADPELRLGTVDFLDPLDELVGTGRTDPFRTGTPDRCLHQVFEERVLLAPDAVAVTFEGVSLSYAEVNVRANRLAHRLRALGAGPESLVGVCLERGIDLVPALLGVLKSGAAYLPLDPAQPVDRLGFMVGDAGAPVLVTQASLVDTVAGFFGGELLVLDEEDLSGLPAGNPAPVSHPEDLIYVIYTSGSTGRPKGVCLTHANVFRLFDTTRQHYQFSADDVWPLFHSYAFDVSVWELWGALLYGGRLVVVPREVTRLPDEFLDLLVAERVTVLNQTPSAFRSLVGFTRDGDPRLDRLALRAVVFAGEKLEMAELAPWTDRFGLDRPALLNMYGITETTVHSTFHQVRAQDITDPGNPVGYPLGDLRIYLLDGYGNLVPVGVPGEIHVGGPGVARGYLRRPELTAQRFVPDPFAGVPGARMYRSGDLARRRPDGGLDFLGRIDDQVQIRGYRVELGEIETVLAAHPGIRDAVVRTDEPEPGQPRIVAYYVPDADQAPTVPELAGYCGKRLPDYMVPGAFVPLAKIPLTANGKLDRRALPTPGRTATGADAPDHVAPNGPVEERIAEIWAELLDVDAGTQTNFFTVGGHSILAVRLASRIQEEFEIDLPVRTVFERPTIARIAEAVEERIRAEIDELSESDLLTGLALLKEQNR